jgi:prepilin-type N-terminal cleavage/methylation domain-containing protein
MFLNKNNKGFTLIELLLATAIFATATVVISDIFIRVNKAQRKTQGIQQTASDARFAIESLVRTTRLSEIDYDYYGGNVSINGESVLALRTTADTPVKFSRKNGSVCPDNSTSVYCLAVCTKESCSSDTDWDALTPQGVNVSLLNFLIYPLSSPFEFDSSTGSYKSDVQPRVTIISNSENITSVDVEKKQFYIQTSVSTRVYKR